MTFDCMKRGVAPVLALIAATISLAQSSTFGGNSQHTGIYAPTAQKLNAIKWQATHELSSSGAFAHYGPPLISASNVFFQPVHTAANGFKVESRNTADGSVRFSLDSDYILPNYNWIPTFNLVLTTGPNGPRLYYPGAGGTLWYIDNPDTTPGAPTRVAFQGNAAYAANPSGFNGTVFVNTPLTADANGNVFFGFRTQNTAPAPLNTTKSGIARVSPNGAATYVLVDAMTSDSNISRTQHNSAPALSNDGATLYVVAKWAANSYYGYLVALDSTTLATKSKVFLKDPRSNGANNAGLLDDSTASPMVAPDGDVFLGVFGNPYNGSRGFLLHFSPDLSNQYTPGAFGWDQTPSVVPASMVPQYKGPSTYLLFSKYNNYALGDGNGINQVAILDPKTTQIDPHSSAGGLKVMREVLTMNGPTPDAEYPSVPNAVREWCINTAVVNPASGEVYFDSEDGHIYAWHLAKNSLTQSVELTSGIGEPYVPSVMGPDGTVYTLNGTYTFALGRARPTLTMALSSSKPSSQTVVAGEPIQFSVQFSGDGTAFSGQVEFIDTYYVGLTKTTRSLGVYQIGADGSKAITTSVLDASTTNLGNHWITANYTGDAYYGNNSATLIQKVHRTATTTRVSTSGYPSPFGSLTLNVRVTPTASGMPTPEGMVTLNDSGSVVGQVALSGGVASFNLNTLSVGYHNLSVAYYGDTASAASAGSLTQLVTSTTATALEIISNPTGVRVPTILRATVSPSVAGAGAPSGRVNFKRDGVLIASATVDPSGVAAVTATNLAVGTGQVTAEFLGQAGWGNSVSSPVTLNVTQMTALQLVNPSVRSGLPVTVNVTLAGTSGGTVFLTSDRPGFTLPNLVVSSGSSTGSVTFNAPLVDVTTFVTITARLNGQTLSTSLRVNPAALGTLAVAPSTVVAGNTSTGTVTLDGTAPAGGITVALGSSSTAATVPAGALVAEGTSTATFTVNTTAVSSLQSATITASLGGIVRSAGLTVQPKAQVTGISLSATSSIGGNRVYLAVYLDNPAPAGGLVVNLTSTLPTANIPASLAVASGAKAGVISFVPDGVDSTVSGSVTATLLPSSASQSFVIQPASIVSLSFNPASVNGGTSSIGTLRLDGAAGPSGRLVTISSNDLSVMVPATITIPSGRNTWQFVANTRGVTIDTSVTVTASSTQTQTATLVVKGGGLLTFSGLSSKAASSSRVARP